MSTGGRIGWSVVGWAIVCVPVLALSGWLRTTLALPPLFETLLKGALVVALPVVVLMAWKYPQLGGAAGADEPTDGSRPEA